MERFMKIISRTLILALGLLFIARFGGPAILRLYVESGIGDCSKTPILCLMPSEQIINPAVDKDYANQLLPYRFTEMEVCLPKGFTVVKEKITRPYYKKHKRLDRGSAIYLLPEKPNFFVNLYPQVVKQGVYDDYVFLRRTMYARLKKIENLTDAFFVVMKSVFIPNLGDQRYVKMAAFTIADKRGFLNYNITGGEHYFDCNIFDSRGYFFKFYIKDKPGALDLDKVFTIVSTMKSP
jgi:hypothetical protein